MLTNTIVEISLTRLTTAPRRPTYDYIRLHTTTYDCIRLYTTTYDYIRLHTTTYDYILLHTTTYDYIRLHTTTYDYIRLHTTTYDYIRLHTTEFTLLSEFHFLHWSIDQSNTFSLVSFVLNWIIIFIINLKSIKIFPSPSSVPSLRITLNLLYNFGILRGITNMTTSDVHESQLINDLMYTRFHYFTDSKQLLRSDSKHLLRSDCKHLLWSDSEHLLQLQSDFTSM